MTEYVTGQELPDRYMAESQLSTGSPELDSLIEGPQRGLFYYVSGKKRIGIKLYERIRLDSFAQLFNTKRISGRRLGGSTRP